MTRIHSVAGLRRGGGLVRRAAVPRAAPHDLRLRPGRRRRASRRPARRARPPRRAVPRRAVGVRRAARSRRCASRSRTAAWRSCAASARAIFPTRFLLVAATNPCPCGHAAVAALPLQRRPTSRATRRRLSGPLLDRIDLLVARRAARPPSASRRSRPRPRQTERARVLAARERQVERLDGDGRDVQRPHGRARCCAAHVSVRRGARAPARRRLRPRRAQRPRPRPRAARGADDRRPRRPATTSRREHLRRGARLSPRRDAGASGWRRERRRDACDACLRADVAHRAAGRLDRDRPPSEARGCARCSRSRRASSSPASAGARAASIADGVRAPATSMPLRAAVERSGLQALCRHDAGLPGAPARPRRRARRPASSPAASRGSRRCRRRPRARPARGRDRRDAARLGRRRWRSPARSDAGWRPRA